MTRRLPEGGEPSTRLVRTFKLAGNRALSDTSIMAKLHYGAWDGDEYLIYIPALVDMDEQRIAALYRERGYFSARAQGRVSRHDGRFVDITMVINESEPTRIAALAVHGVPDVLASPEEALAVVHNAGLQRGQIMVHDKYLAAKERVKNMLDRGGYVFAKVDGTVRVDRDRRTAAIDIRVEPGPRAYFGEVTIRGNQRIPDSAIAARIAWSRGDVFNTAKLDQTRKALFALDMFRVVRIDYDRSTPGSTIDITIDVREGKRHELKLGGGVRVEGAGGIVEQGLAQSRGARMEVRGRGEITVRSFVDPLLTVHLGVKPGYMVLPGGAEEHAFLFEARTDFDRQDLFVPRLILGGAAWYTMEQYEAYAERGPRANMLLERPFWDERLHLSAGMQGEYLTVMPSAGITMDNLGTGSPVGAVFVYQTAQIDGRDDRLHPHSGWFAQARLEQGVWLANASGTYARSMVDVRAYAPASRRLVMAGRARGGLLNSTARGAEPITQRFFGGGLSHRGFGVRRLAPTVLDRDGDTVPVGGAALLEASVELRADMIRLGDGWLGSVFFVDVGDVVASPGALDPTYLHVAVGMGLRYDTPIGPVRLDIGVRVNRLRSCQVESCPDPDPDRPVVFHFSVGEAF